MFLRIGPRLKISAAAAYVLKRPDWGSAGDHFRREGGLAERSQFKLSGPFERDLAPHRQRISVAFPGFLRIKGTRELKRAENTAELGP
jgi:hypothetical protein